MRKSPADASLGSISPLGSCGFRLSIHTGDGGGGVHPPPHPPLVVVVWYPARTWTSRIPSSSFFLCHMHTQARGCVGSNPPPSETDAADSGAHVWSAFDSGTVKKKEDPSFSEKLSSSPMSSLRTTIRCYQKLPPIWAQISCPSDFWRYHLSCYSGPRLCRLPDPRPGQRWHSRRVI